MEQLISIEYRTTHLDNLDEKSFHSLINEYGRVYFSRLQAIIPDIIIPSINLVFTENIYQDILEKEEQIDGLISPLQPKGLTHIFKIFDHNEHKIVFVNVYGLGDQSIFVNLFTLLLQTFVEEHISKINNVPFRLIKLDGSLQEFLLSLFTNWLFHEKSKIIVSPIITLKENDSMSMDVVFPFKRNVRLLHYEYQRDKNIAKFHNRIIAEVDIFIRRILKDKSFEDSQNLGEIKDEVINLIGLIETYSNEKIHVSRFPSHNQLMEVFVPFFSKCFFEMYDDTEGLRIRILKSPKKLFSDIPDTLPSIVCFMDVLGFKSIIHEYESNSQSTALKELKEAFEWSVKYSRKLIVDLSFSDDPDQIEFKMFSDNILIAFPYIEFGYDMWNGFHTIATIVSTFQQIFMYKGFYLRGHTTLGSYYSDSNMIFSGGLVEAYENERKTVYPVVSVNDKIIEKIKEVYKNDSSLPKLENLLIKHSNESVHQNIIFNPLFTTQTLPKIDSIISGFTEGILDDFSFVQAIKDEFLRTYGIDLEKRITEETEMILIKLTQNYEELKYQYNNLKMKEEDKDAVINVMNKLEFLKELLEWILEQNDSDFQYLTF